MGNKPLQSENEKRYFYQMDEMSREALVPSMTSAEGVLVQGDKLYVGLVHKARGTGSQPHRHPFEQFNYVLKGALKAWVNGKEEEVAAGGLIHIPANTLHTIVASADGDAVFLMLKEVTPMGIKGVTEDPNVTGPRYDSGYDPKVAAT